MGINKVPENGHNLLTTQVRAEKSKLTVREKHGHADKLSIQKSGVKSKIGGTFLAGGIKPRKEANVGTPPTNVENPKKVSKNSSFSFDMKDALTGELFADLARRSFERRRPYCFAVGVVSSNNASAKKKLFLDGAEYFQGVDEDAFKMPHQLTLKSGEQARLTDVNFFLAREDNSIDKVGSIYEAINGVNSAIVQTIILQDEDELYERTGNTTSVLIAGAYHLGIGVKSDKEYARKIMPEINNEQKEEATPDAYNLALMCQDSARLVKFLLDNHFDPSVKDPDDGSTSIQVAIKDGNKEVLQLFEKYGYWSNA